jgi:hypothetical protein
MWVYFMCRLLECVGHTVQVAKLYGQRTELQGGIHLNDPVYPDNAIQWRQICEFEHCSVYSARW